MVESSFNRTKEINNNQLLLLVDYSNNGIILIFIFIFMAFFSIQLFNSSIQGIDSYKPSGIFLIISNIAEVVLIILIGFVLLGLVYFSLLLLKNIMFRNKILITENEIILYYMIFFITYYKKKYNKNNAVISIYYKNKQIDRFFDNEMLIYSIMIVIGKSTIGIRKIRKELTLFDKKYFDLLKRYNMRYSEPLKNFNF